MIHSYLSGRHANLEAIAANADGLYMLGMQERPTERAYARPPITEAVIELRFAEPPTETRLGKASDWLRRRYDNINVEDQIEGLLDFGTRTAEFRRSGPQFQHSSADQTASLSLTLQHAAWVQRAPYPGWKVFIKRFEEEAALTLKAIGSVKLARLGLRYVNRIDVPRSEDGLFKYEDYLNYRIEPGPLLDTLTAFQWMVRSQKRENGIFAVVQSAVVEPEVPQHQAFAFDIDVALEDVVPTRLEDLLSVLATMRDFKNEIFEGGVTPLAKALYS